MKLAKEKLRKGKLRAPEVVGESEEPLKLEFNLDSDVPAEKWSAVDSMIESFVADQKNGFQDGMAVCTLAVFKPDIMRRLRASVEFKSAMLKLMEGYWDRVLDNKNLLDLSIMTVPLQVLPDIRHMRQVTEQQFDDLLQQARKDFQSVEVEPFQFMALLEFFPEQLEKIRSVMDSPLIKQRFLQEVSGSKLRESDLFGVASSLKIARLLYPEESQRFQHLARPFWSAMKHAIQVQPLNEATFYIHSLVILSAEDARILEDGSVQIIPASKQVYRGRELPERLIAS